MELDKCHRGFVASTLRKDKQCVRNLARARLLQMAPFHTYQLLRGKGLLAQTVLKTGETHLRNSKTKTQDDEKDSENLEIYGLRDVGAESPIHIFTDNTSALSLSNKLGLNKRSKHIALRYLFAQDIQTTGLVNIQRVTSHNNPALGLQTSIQSALYHQCWGDIFDTTESLKCTSKRGSSTISTWRILELAAQYVNDSGEDISYTEEQLQRLQDKEQRLRA